MKDFLLEASPNPERKGCPDEDVIQALAEDRLPADHPALAHVASCSECYAEFLDFRNDWKESRGSKRAFELASESNAIPKLQPGAVSSPLKIKGIPLAIAAGLILAVAGFFVMKQHPVSGPAASSVASNASVSVAVNLFDVPTRRGGGEDEDAVPLQEVTLPAGLVHLAITLPRFSENGKYQIQVLRDRTGQGLVATGSGDAEESNGRVSVKVELDLRNAKSGTYFLATVRGSDNGTYYYPLKVN
ncbi:hypothetical protein BH10ACI4_BH10ACI4_36230 [soil metagenome]